MARPQNSFPLSVRRMRGSPRSSASRSKTRVTGKPRASSGGSTRLGDFHAGPESAGDPKYTVIPQRDRIDITVRVLQSGKDVTRWERVFAYPRLDTVVWNGDAAPAPARVLAFDEEAGQVSLVDTKGQPVRIDFRQGSATTVTKSKLTGVASNDGSTIYGISSDGAVQRFATSSGTWEWKPPVAARAVFPQPDASLLVLGERSERSVVWRVRPPSTRIADSVVLPKVDRALRTQVGDLLFLASEKELTGVRTRTMAPTASVAFDEPVELLAATPSGDRVFVVTSNGTAVQIVDRYREQVSGQIALGRHPSDLRMDPLGRYLLARLDGVDSTAVIALGTNQVVGTVATGWRADLPFVAPDGGIALAQGKDVVVTDMASRRAPIRVTGGAADFWDCCAISRAVESKRASSPAYFNNDFMNVMRPPNRQNLYLIRPQRGSQSFEWSGI